MTMSSKKNFFSLLDKIKWPISVSYFFLTVVIFLLTQLSATAQDPADKPDTFFLAKKKGLLGRFGRSISTHTPDRNPEKVENPFLPYKGKIIRSIEIAPLGFQYDLYDTTKVKNDFIVKLARRFHKNTTALVIRRNLFFEQGSQVYPYLLADNERYLRDLEYIKDARILVAGIAGSADSVDVVVLTRDVFSIGGRVSASSIEKATVELKEENLYGSGNRLSLLGFYEKQRSPENAWGVELLKRNIKGSFINWTAGFQNFHTSFSSYRNDETTIYTKLEKPLVTPYIPSTGAIEARYAKTGNNYYTTDSVYNKDHQYEYYNIDAWFGYSLDSRRSLYANKEIRVHRFIAVRAFKQQFLDLPQQYETAFDYRFANFAGILASLNIFRQVFYKTNFVYGFGRNEDIPEGFTFALTAGYINKQKIKRPYGGIDLQLTNFKEKGFYSNYTFRLGGYFHRKRFEDVDLLADAQYFTRLKKMNSSWFHRAFISAGVTTQINPVLNTPLFLNSIYGLPYFNNDMINADLRATVKIESVFYNVRKILGFRFAPFVFGDMSMLKPSKQNLDKSMLFSAIGGGVRTRNENLVFGTIELKGYYFPRTNGDMREWKIELNSNIRFRYKSSFINRPEVIIAN